MIAIIDADSYIFTACHNKKDQPIKSLEDCKNHIDSLLMDTLNKVGASHFLLFLTVGKCFRYDIDPNYKKSRKDKPKPEFFNEVRHHLWDKWGAIYDEDWEADDMVLSASKLIPNSVIVSADNDLLKLEGKHFNCRGTGNWVTTTWEEAEYKFWSDMICGQTGDSIAGIKGKGPKFAEKLLTGESFRNNVLWAYCDHYGEYEGVCEFYKNYRLLKIVDNVPFDLGLKPLPVPQQELPLFEIPPLEWLAKQSQELNLGYNLDA